MISKLISGIFQSLPLMRASSQLSSAVSTTPVLWNPWNLTFVRNKMRYHFPHPNERMRIKNMVGLQEWQHQVVEKFSKEEF